MGVHDGHRARLKQRFLEQGLNGFEDHNALELLLFYALPYKDTNPVAHALIKRFGSLAGAMDAPLHELIKVDGISEHSAILIKLIPQMCRKYLVSGSRDGSRMLDNVEAAGRYASALLFAERDEMVYAIFLDSLRRVIACDLIVKGSVNSAEVSVRKIVEIAISHNASSVILTHNHPGGIALPSEADDGTTRKIHRALHAVGIELSDHIIVADNDYVSMAQDGFFERL